MIRINLAPIDEIEDRHWWIPDVVTFFVLLGLTVAGGNYYLSLKRAEVDRLIEEERNLTASIQSMSVDAKTHDEMLAKIENLDNLRASFSNITQSKVERYLPLVLLEHIQSLKPDGVWLTGIYFKSEGNSPREQTAAEDQTGQNAQPAQTAPTDQSQSATAPTGRRDIEITGRAFDHVILAEFMTLLKATRNQDYHQNDVRSQIFFDQIGLHFTGITAVPRMVGNVSESVEIVEFKIAAYYDQRTERASEPGQTVSEVMNNAVLTSKINTKERL
ncbi:MAG: hypothetical protein AB7T49_09445 [Oligoflexales bacterium]